VGPKAIKILNRKVRKENRSTFRDLMTATGIL
jgi:hypothetical protein